MAEHHTKILENAYAAFGRGDVPAILETCADDVEWSTNLDQSLPGASDVTWTRTFHGRNEAAKFFAELAADVDFKKFQPTGFFHGGDTVVVRISSETTVKKTGKSVGGEIFHEFTFNQHNQVKRFRSFSDTALLLAAHK
jgi:ketosteroid isomerase-like protein